MKLTRGGEGFTPWTTEAQHDLTGREMAPQAVRTAGQSVPEPPEQLPV